MIKWQGQQNAQVKAEPFSPVTLSSQRSNQWLVGHLWHICCQQYACNFYSSLLFPSSLVVTQCSIESRFGQMAVAECSACRCAGNLGSSPTCHTKRWQFSDTAEWPQATHMLSWWPPINPDTRETLLKGLSGALQGSKSPARMVPL